VQLAFGSPRSSRWRAVNGIVNTCGRRRETSDRIGDEQSRAD
jgi:hypothetical protein